MNMMCPYQKRVTTQTNPVTGIVTMVEEPLQVECTGESCPYCIRDWGSPPDRCYKIKAEYEANGWR